MSDIKLFRTSGNVEELPGTSVTVEKSLQVLFENNLEAFIGVRLLASEYSTGPIHGGRIDTLGIDENNCPVILEYKRATNQNVINQGLYYLDWLLDHKAEFQLLVQKALDVSVAEDIDWSSPRLICIAGDYTKFDQHAVQQINRQIELFRYKRYGDELLILELVNVPAGKSSDSAALPSYGQPSASVEKGNGIHGKTFEDILHQIDSPLRDLYEAFKEYMLSLGDDVQVKRLKRYEAYKRIRNVAAVVIQPQKRDLLVYIYKSPEMHLEQYDMARFVDKQGHWGTGDVEIVIRSWDDLERVKSLLDKAYERS